MPDAPDGHANDAERLGEAPPWPAVVLIVPTFRRPEGLRKLLAHVAALSYRGPLSVIVIENDAEERAGVAMVAALAPTFPFHLEAIVEQRRGQTYAYNRGFQEACRARPNAKRSADYIAVLDDDEYPDRAWLSRMVATAKSLDADIVGGPVLPVFDDPRHWLATSGLYAPKRFASGRVDMIYGAGSMLAKRSTIEDYLDEPFSHAFAFTGGSDLAFFTRCHSDGRTFAWSDTALVFETTPRSRVTLAWLLRRNFRKGAERVRIDRLARAPLRTLILRCCRGPALVAAGCLALPFAALFGRGAIASHLSRIARGAGRIAGAFDVVTNEYG
jgi:glycosyltransferase involved in cell wall biosynthesis